MASSSNVSLDQLSSDSLARVEKDPDLRATLAAIADRIHTQPDEASAIALKDWEQWLDGEGYNTQSLKAFIASLLQSEGIARSLSSIGPEQNVSSLISVMEQELPNILDLLLETVDHSVKLHEGLFGLAGGTSRPPMATSLKLIQSKKQTATREAAAEASLSPEVSSDYSRDTERLGPDGTQKGYSQDLDAVRSERNYTKVGREEDRKTRTGMDGSSEDRPSVQRVGVRGRINEARGALGSEVRNAFMPGYNGHGEQKLRERSVEKQFLLNTLSENPHIREARKVLGGDFREIDPTSLSKMLDDLRSDVVQITQDARGRSERLNDNQRSDEVQISQDARGRREVLNRDYNDPDLRLVRAIDDVRDALDVREVAKVNSDLTKAVAALKFELEPKQLERVVERLFDVDGRDGAGEQKDYSIAIDKARAELSDSGLDAPRLKRVLNDLRAVKDSENRFPRMFDELENDLKNHPDDGLDDLLRTGVATLREELGRFRDPYPVMEKRVMIEGGVTNDVDQFEQNKRGRTIDKVKEELSDSGLDARSLRRIMNGLRDIREFKNQFPRTFDQLENALNNHSDDRLDDSLRNDVSKLREELRWLADPNPYDVPDNREVIERSVTRDVPDARA